VSADHKAVAAELRDKLDNGGTIRLELLRRTVAALERLNEREARQLAGLKARKITAEQRAEELERVAPRWRYITAGYDTVEEIGSYTKRFLPSDRGRARTNADVLALLVKSFPSIPKNRLRSYVTELRRARRKEQAARREAVRARIERTTAEHTAHIQAERARAKVSSPEAVRKYLAERELQAAKK
jgi:hypothetical protein